MSEHVTLVDTMSDTRLDRQGVIDKFGVPPERIIDYLALMGDSFDNIPGVPKVGPKTAAKWITDYGALEGVIAQPPNIKGKIGENLRASLALSADVEATDDDQDATSSCTVGVEALIPDAPDLAKLRELFTRFEFRAWVDELPAEEGAPPSAADSALATEKRYETIVDWGALDLWLERIRERGRMSLDTETTTQDYMRARAGRHRVRDRGRSRGVRAARSRLSRRAAAACRAMRSLRG